MFKDRLKITFRWIFENIIAPILAVTVVGGVFLFVSIKVPILIDISLWTIGVFLALVLLIGLIIFVYWLFIEPFKKQEEIK